MEAEGVHVDFCRDCKGIWFEEGELAFYSETENDIVHFVENSKSAAETNYNCPTCENEKLSEFKYHADEELLIDFCNGCRGIFLDKMEVTHVEAIVGKYGLSRFESILKTLKSEGYEVIK